jgi:hypothetical protein
LRFFERRPGDGGWNENAFYRTQTNATFSVLIQGVPGTKVNILGGHTIGRKVSDSSPLEVVGFFN